MLQRHLNHVTTKTNTSQRELRTYNANYQGSMSWPVYHIEAQEHAIFCHKYSHLEHMDLTLQMHELHLGE